MRAAANKLTPPQLARRKQQRLWEDYGRYFGCTYTIYDPWRAELAYAVFQTRSFLCLWPSKVNAADRARLPDPNWEPKEGTHYQLFDFPQEHFSDLRVLPESVTYTKRIFKRTRTGYEDSIRRVQVSWFEWEACE